MMVQTLQTVDTALMENGELGLDTTYSIFRVFPVMNLVTNSVPNHFTNPVMNLVMMESLAWGLLTAFSGSFTTNIY